MIATLIILFHILGLISSLHSVMSTRTTQGTIAWVISLNTMPYIAVPAYWILGRNRFKGYVKAHQTSERNLDKYEQMIENDLGPYRIPEADIQVSGRAAEKLTDMPYLKANHVELLIDGEATFDSIIQGIDEAESYGEHYPFLTICL